MKKKNNQGGYMLLSHDPKNPFPNNSQKIKILKRDWGAENVWNTLESWDSFYDVIFSKCDGIFSKCDGIFPKCDGIFPKCDVVIPTFENVLLQISFVEYVSLERPRPTFYKICKISPKFARKKIIPIRNPREKSQSRPKRKKNKPKKTIPKNIQTNVSKTNSRTNSKKNNHNNHNNNHNNHSRRKSSSKKKQKNGIGKPPKNLCRFWKLKGTCPLEKKRGCKFSHHPDWSKKAIAKRNNH